MTSASEVEITFTNLDELKQLVAELNSNVASLQQAAERINGGLVWRDAAVEVPMPGNTCWMPVVTALGIGMGWYDDIDSAWYDDNDAPLPVTYWMPLPPTPEVEP